MSSQSVIILPLFEETRLTPGAPVSSRLAKVFCVVSCKSITASYPYTRCVNGHFSNSTIFFLALTASSCVGPPLLRLPVPLVEIQLRHFLLKFSGHRRQESCIDSPFQIPQTSNSPLLKLQDRHWDRTHAPRSRFATLDLQSSTAKVSTPFHH